VQATTPWEGNVKLPRRQFLHLAAGAAALPIISHTALAQAYPTRPVRWIVGFAAGGPSDTMARVMGQCLNERLGQPFVVENRPGAGTNIATEAVVKAPPDGYTLLQFSTSAAINESLYDKLNFNFIRDISPIASMVRMSDIIVVHPSVPANNIPEFIAYTKANPDKITLASPGIGTTPHLSSELFKAMTGANMIHAPYRGEAPALTDLLGGQVHVMFASRGASTIANIRAGKLRVLATTGAERWEGLPDLPTVAEFVPGYETSAWWGVGAPRDISADIVDKLNREINAALAEPKIRARIAELGGTMFAASPGAFNKFIADEVEKWAKVIRAANIKPE
jgi:tripartite-type tricarboxylate transporter receptor subunit TctC